jgi:hypothetical protein
MTTIEDLQRKLEASERLSVALYLVIVQAGLRLPPHVEEQLTALRIRHGDKATQHPPRA